MYTDNDYATKNKLLSSYQLSKLHTFEVVARNNSFSLAAKELFITPSAVSHRINSLERDLGIKLFNRLHRNIKITPEGKSIFLVLNKSLMAINQKILDIHSKEPSGKLTVYARPSITQLWLAPNVVLFNKKHPSIELNIITGNSDIDLNRHEVDIALYFDDNKNNIQECDFLMNEYITPVCSIDYAKKYDLMNKFNNIGLCTLLHDNQAWGFSSYTDEWMFWNDTFNAFINPPQKNIFFDRSDLAITAAINNAGIAIGRTNIIKNLLEKKILIEPFHNTRKICKQKYYILKPRNIDSKVNVFIDWIKENLAG